MKNQPLVSIIIPLYNGANYVEEALTCALAQTYERIEIVVVNDGSTDSGAGRDICLRYGDKIVYLEKENGGCASALNYGIRHARGEFISWLSHDDLYEPTKIAHQIAQYEAKSLDRSKTVISNVGGLIDGEGKAIFHPTRRETGLFCAYAAFEYFLFHSCPNGCGLLIPKRLFEEISYFDENMRFVLDWNLWLKFALRGVDFYFDDKCLVSNRVHSMQVTVKQKELHAKETNETVDQLFALIKECAGDEAYLKALYAFSYACERGNTRAIGAHIKNSHIKVRRAHLAFLRIKSRLTHLAKKIYHWIR